MKRFWIRGARRWLPAFLAALLLAGCAGKKAPDALQAPAFEEAAPDGAVCTIEQLVWEDGALAWRAKSDRLIRTEDGFFCPESFFAQYTPENIPILAEHRIGAWDDAAASVREDGYDVRGAVCWWSAYYIFARKGDAAALFPPGEGGGEAIPWEEFLAAARRYCEANWDSSLSGGSGLDFS